MSETAVLKRENPVQVQEAKGEIVYTPFASADPIKLSIIIVQKWLCKPTKKGVVCSESDAMRLMMLCRARRLNPWEGDAYIVGYDGKDGAEFSIISAHQALLKRCEPQPSFQGMDSGVIVSPGFACKACEEGFTRNKEGKVQRCEHCHGSGVIDEIQGDIVPEDQKLIGGWAHLVRSDRAIPYHRRLSVSAYRPPYQNKFWDSNAAGQIVKCAEADCMRSAYPTLVGGLYPEGDNGFSIVTRDAAAVPSMMAPPPAAKQLNPSPRTAPVSSFPRRGPTLVEEPLSQDEAAEAAMGLAPVQQQSTESPVERGPERPTAAPAAAVEATPQDQLAEIVTGAGYTFDQFKQWGKESQGDGNTATGILAWDTYAGFDEIPSAWAKFFVRAKTGMLAGLKGGV